MAIKKYPYTQCTRCIMSVDDDPEITFDDKGVCSYCYLYDTVLKNRLYNSIGSDHLQKLIERIKADGKGKEYDCVLGVSGGIDSTYTAYLAVQLGLRPILVSFDNGWDTDIAKRNIESLKGHLGLALETYTMDWPEFRDIQLAYLKASVVDIEAPTDHAIGATLYRAAEKHGVQYIVSGENYITEGVLPVHWVHNKSDAVNIKAIHKKWGSLPLKTFPLLTLKERNYLIRVKHIQYIRLLDYIVYNKDVAKKEMQEKLGWIDYKEKHFESIFTRFFQSYILPVKFGVDKRKVHFSVLVQSGQMTREEALRLIAKPPQDEVALQKDKMYVINKLGLSEAEFESIMALPVKSHYAFPTQQRWRYLARKLKRFIVK